MIDKRKFHYFLNQSKDEYPQYLNLIESIQNEFEEKIEGIADAERQALKQYPIQYVARIPQDKGNWTSQLHIWAEEGIPEIIELDPIFLAFKNSVGDSVLMSFIIGAVGGYTEKTNYDLIKKVLNTDLSYEDVQKDKDKEQIIIKNALDEEDLNGNTVLDYLIDFAYGIGQFDGMEPDSTLQEMLKEFCKVNPDNIQEETTDVSEELPIE